MLDQGRHKLASVLNRSWQSNKGTFRASGLAGLIHAPKQAGVRGRPPAIEPRDSGRIASVGTRHGRELRAIPRRGRPAWRSTGRHFSETGSELSPRRGNRPEFLLPPGLDPPRPASSMHPLSVRPADP